MDSRAPFVSKMNAIRFGICLSIALTLLVFSTLLASPDAATVLVIVPAGSELASVEAARSAVRAPTRALLVAESDRVRLKGGFEMLVDRSFGNAPVAELIVLVSGDAGRAEEAFLTDRRRTARAIVLPSGSPIAERVRGEGSGNALILVGGVDSIAAVLAALGAPAPADATRAHGSPAPAETSPAPPRSTPSAARPSMTPTPGSAGRVFDRYFSSSPPTPTPSPR
jgi:hypothetical protein